MACTARFNHVFKRHSFYMKRYRRSESKIMGMIYHITSKIHTGVALLIR